MNVAVVAVPDGATLLDDTGRLRTDEVRTAIAVRLSVVEQHLRQTPYPPCLFAGQPRWRLLAVLYRNHVQVIELPEPGGEQVLLRLAAWLISASQDRMILEFVAEGLTG